MRHLRFKPSLVASSLAVLTLATTALLARGQGVTAAALRVPRLAEGGEVRLVAGSADIHDGGKAIEAVVAGVAGMAVDPAGNLYFSDSGHGRVRKIDVKTGTIETIAGNGMLISEESSALATQKALRGPGPLAIDAEGRFLYVGEIAGRRVQKIDLSNDTLQELPIPAGDGFGRISGLAWTPTGLVVADSERGQIWKLARSVWIGVLPESGLLRGGIRAMARDRMGHLYISEFDGHRVLKLDTNSGRVTNFVGNGQAGPGKPGGKAAETAISTPDGLAFAANGDLLVADLGNQRILEVDAESSQVAVVHQSSAPKGGVLEWSPGALALDVEGNLWVGDVHHDRVLRFAVGATQPDVIAGGGSIGDGGPAAQAQLAQPGSVVADRWGNVYISDTLHHRVRVVDAETGTIRTLVGTGNPGFNGDGQPGTRTWLAYPAHIQVDDKGRVYISDYRNHRVRLYDPVTGTVSTVAGNGKPGNDGDGGPATEASIDSPHAIYLDGPDTLVVASATSSTLRRVDLRSGRIWHMPLVDPSVPADRPIFSVARWGGLMVLVMPEPQPGSIDLLSRTGRLTRMLSPPEIDSPYQVAVSPEEQVFICDTGRNQVLRWAGEQMKVIAQGLGRPRAISFDPEGNLLIADTFNNRVLRIDLHVQPGVLVQGPRRPAPRAV